jgi:hypothetical protein
VRRITRHTDYAKDHITAARARATANRRALNTTN